MAEKCSAVIVAGGKGLRMGLDIPKQYIELHHKPVLVHTIEKFHELDIIKEIVLVVPEKDILYCQNEIKDKFHLFKVKKIVGGGSQRQFSVYEGLKACDKSCDIILVHDGVRPFAEGELIEAVYKGAAENGGAVPCVAVKDSIKKGKNNAIEKSVDRDSLYMAQTPQGFRRQVLLDAYKNAFVNNIEGTDDSFLVEQLGYSPLIVQGSYKNIKITTAEDLAYAEFLMKDQ